MNKRSLFATLSLLVTSVAFAQPPEEVPPPLPETSEQVTVPEAAPILPPAVIPVAEPKLAAPTAAPEDKRIKGVSVSPSLRIAPIGYDSVNITSPEARGFFAMKPEIGLSTSFKTDTDKTIDFSVDYALEWREYFNKVSSKRDFDNDATGSIGMKVNELLGFSMPYEFEYFFKIGADAAQDSGLVINLMPTASFTATKELSFKLGYEFWYINNINSPIGPDGQFIYTDPVADADALSRGSLDSTATGFSNWDPALVTGTATQFFFEHRAVVGTTYKVTPSTTVALTYRYRFANPSNSEEAMSYGHYLVPKVTQSLPWKGGSVSLTDELRMRKFVYADANPAFPGVKKQDFRNRITLDASQEINDYMGVQLYWRFQISGKNTDDYAAISKANHFYIGMNFKF